MNEKIIGAAIALISLFVVSEGIVKYETATLAGGCFWCMTPPYKNQPGAMEVYAGYTGGKTEKFIKL